MASLMEDLGLRVTELRESMRRSQEELAERIGLTRSGLGYIERGKINPRIEVLDRLASAFMVDAADLFTFPWKRYSRHRARELIRVMPDDKIPGLVAAMEDYIEREMPIARVFAKKQVK